MSLRSENIRQKIEYAMKKLLEEHDREIVSLKLEIKQLKQQNTIMKAVIEGKDERVSVQQESNNAIEGYPEDLRNSHTSGFDSRDT